MRHGVAFRKLSRTSSHRNLMLRNMVSSLLEHEQIRTTLAKAKEASRLAEWVITWGKEGTLTQRRRAEGFLMNADRTVPKLFNDLAKRYASRPGGYTRVHLYGNRKGDHAPQAILELVDNPNDLRFHMTARIAGRQLASIVKRDKFSATEVMQWATSTIQPTSGLPKIYGLLSPLTQQSVQKALNFARRNTSTSEDQVATSPSASSSIASTSIATLPISTSELTLSNFDKLVRESFFRTTAISKVPIWDADLEKYEDLLINAKDSPERVPVTVPGQGRKVWAGQEDLEKRYEEQAQEVWVDEREVLQHNNAANSREDLLRKKLRHPQGRNGTQGQRSAIARAKGHQAPPRSLSERRARLDMPNMSYH